VNKWKIEEHGKTSTRLSTNAAASVTKTDDAITRQPYVPHSSVSSFPLSFSSSSLTFKLSRALPFLPLHSISFLFIRVLPSGKFRKCRSLQVTF